MKYWLLALLTCLPLLTHGQDTLLPPSFSAEYDVTKDGFKIGEARRSFERRDDGRHLFESESRTTGLIGLLFREDILEQSFFTYTGGHGTPQEYLYRRDGRKDRRIVQNYDWEQGVVTSKVDGEVNTIALMRGAVDQNMYQLSLMVDLSRGQRNMDYPMVLKRKLKVIPIRHLRDEVVETALGRFNTVVVQRAEETSKTTMWCAEELNFLPIRIEHVENGDEFVADITELTGLMPRSRPPLEAGVLN